MGTPQILIVEDEAPLKYFKEYFEAEGYNLRRQTAQMHRIRLIK